MTRLTYESHRNDDMVRLALAGEFDLSNAAQIEDALKQIERDRTLACPEVQYLIDFIRTSQRGVILRRAARRAEEVAADE